MKFWQTNQFRKLQNDWYERLKTTGFVDAEEMISGEMQLKQFSGAAFRVNRGKEQLVRENIEAYFCQLGEKAHNQVYDNHIEEMIMQAYADGARVCHILQMLRENQTPRCRTTVFNIMRHYLNLWGMKNYNSRRNNE